MFNIIPLIVILAGLVVILIIVVKKFPLLASFDVKSMPQEKQAETKDKIIEQRLQRKAKVFYGKISPFFKTIFNYGQRKAGQVKDKFKEYEEKYKKQARQETLVTAAEFNSLEKKIEGLFAEAKEFFAKEEYPEAEKKYIEVISLEPKNIEAYRGLGELYIVQDHFEEARQTYEHILKLNKLDDQAFFELAEIYLRLDNTNKALVNLEKALKVSPNHPKYLDLLVTISIMIKDKEKAKEALSRLREANPDNAKIDEFKNQIKEL